MKNKPTINYFIFEDLCRIEPDSPYCGLEEKIHLGREVLGPFKNETQAINEIEKLKRKRKKEGCEQRYQKNYYTLCSRINNILWDNTLKCYRTYEVKENADFTS